MGMYELLSWGIFFSLCVVIWYFETKVKALKNEISIINEKNKELHNRIAKLEKDIDKKTNNEQGF